MGRFVSLVKTYSRLGVLLACLFFSYSAFAKKPAFQCAKYDVQLLAALKNKYSINSIGVSNLGFAVQVFLDRSGNWLMLGIDDDLNACKILQGTDWSWMATGDL